MKASHLSLQDRTPATETFLTEVQDGLSRTPKTLPCKYFYDETGSTLFDQICMLEEYYPTRTELNILRDHVEEMAELLGPECMVLEPGSGTGMKTRVLLDHLEDPSAYVPIEISKEFLLHSAVELDRKFPEIEILPVCADFHEKFEIPVPKKPVRRRVLYFPGSTIGNLTPDRAESFLRRFLKMCGPQGAILIGVDWKKDRAILEKAYNDAGGITAAFNLNLLQRINNELGADFVLECFQHRAVYNESRGRIEMHLVSLKEQTVQVDDRQFAFQPGETIRTELSHKFAPGEFQLLAERASARVSKQWTDPKNLFGVLYLTPHSHES